jgi:hypothetical protein
MSGRQDNENGNLYDDLTPNTARSPQITSFEADDEGPGAENGSATWWWWYSLGLGTASVGRKRSVLVPSECIFLLWSVMDRAKLSKGDIECGNLCTLDAVHSRLRQPTELRNAVPPHGLSSAPHALRWSSLLPRGVRWAQRCGWSPKLLTCQAPTPTLKRTLKSRDPPELTVQSRPVRGPTLDVDRTTFLCACLLLESPTRSPTFCFFLSSPAN